MRLLICDDHAIFREGLKTILASLDAELIEAKNATEAAARLADAPDVDLVLLDIEMPGGDGWSALDALRANHPHIPAVLISAHEDPTVIQRALDAGASGFIPKSSAPPILRGAIQLVLDGGVYLPPQLLGKTKAADAPPPAAPNAAPPEALAKLTPRQKEILLMVSRGLTNAEIAESLKIAEATVKTHVSALLQALDVTNRTEAALMLHQMEIDLD